MSFLYDLFQAGLGFLYSALPNWALVILASALLIRALLAPIQVFTTQQQLRLKRIQPELEALRTQYAADLPKYLAETRRVKESAGVKTGWLFTTSILQAVIFIGMFGALTTSSLLSASGLFWMPSLAVPDPLFVLPVMMGSLTYFQFKTSLASAPVRIPAWVLPTAAGVLTAALPAGVLLFSLANSGLTLASQSLIERWL